MRGFRDILQTSSARSDTRRWGIGGIFKGGRRGGETQYALPRPPLNCLLGFGVFWQRKRPQEQPTLRKNVQVLRILTIHPKVYIICLM
jgi:hypothetical protein